MKLFKSKITWWDELEENDKIDLVYGFADDLIDLMKRIERSYSNINTIEIQTVNSFCSEEELLWVGIDDQRTQDAIEKENDY